MAKQKAKRTSKAKSAAKSAPKPESPPPSRSLYRSRARKAKRGERTRRARPSGDDRDRQSARRHRARDDQHAVARGALGGDFERARFLLLHPHRRQSAARLGRRVAGAHLRRPPAGREHVALSRGRYPRGRRLSRQRSVRRQHPPGRPHLSGAGVHRRRASVHHRRQVPHGRHRQQHSVELLRQGAGRLRGRRAGFSRRAHPARLQERAGRHPHVPGAHPRARSMVRRRARRARLGAHRRAPPEGAVPQIRRGDDQGLHQGLVRLFGAARDRVDPQAAGGTHHQYRPFRSARRHSARRPGAQRDGRDRSEKGDDRGRSARQSALRRLRPQYLARGGDKLRGRRDLQQPGQGHSAQRRLVPPAVVPICREQRGRLAGVSAQLLDRDHQRLRAAGEHHAVGVRAARRGTRAWPKAAPGSAPAWPCSPARITGATTRATSTA